MTELDLPNDADIARASAEWLACRAAGDAHADWVEDLTLDWLRFGNYKAMWRFVLKLCADVPKSDHETIGMVGVVRYTTWSRGGRSPR
jgi:orotate phosphoribosyltransferase-like protein